MRIVVLVMMCGALSIAQQQAPSSAKQPAAKGQIQSSSSGTATKAGITVESVVDMVQAGLSEDLIVTSLRKEGRSFDLSPADMIRLKKANVTDNVLKIMLDPKAEIRPLAPAAVQSVQPPPSVPQRAPAQPPSAAAVQVAVNQIVDWTRKGGAILVRGVQEFSAQNEARADLQFNDFQYNANGFSHIPKPRNEVTPPEPNVNSPTFYSDMANIPARERHVARYSGSGSATIKHYSDGRWVLTQIDFNFLQITGSVPISSIQAPTVPTPNPVSTDASPAELNTSPSLPTASNPPPSAISLAGKWKGQIMDAQGTHTVTLALGENGAGSGSVITAAVRGSSKTFDLTAKLRGRGSSVSGTLEYKYKMLLLPCNATMSISAQSDGADRWIGTYTSKSSCSSATENGTISLQRN